jgi:hypothetical protein
VVVAKDAVPLVIPSQTAAPSQNIENVCPRYIDKSIFLYPVSFGS